LSWQVSVLTVLSRWIGLPMLQRTATPAQAARDFERAAAVVFRPVPYHLCIERGQDPRLHWISVGPVTPRRIILYFHGGGYLAGSPRTHLAILTRLAQLTGVEVCAPAYRLLQTAPFPAAFDDAVAAWDHLMAMGYRPDDVVLAGDSAGGGLAFALLSHVTLRGQTPAAVVALSPWVDLTLSGPSLSDPAESFLPVSRMPEVVDLYLRGADPSDPRASPLFARFVAPPPVLIHYSSTEALRDDALRMAACLTAAGGDVSVKAWPKTPHAWHILDGWVPEARMALHDVATFIQTSFAKASR
jgi:epsilon-lactone hydrolase